MKLKRFNEFVNENKNILLAPNGKPSNLNEFQYNQVRTQEFIAWFGDWINDPLNSSKMVDENGEPLLVRHQSQSNTEFEFFKEKAKKNDWSVSKKGIYFSSAPGERLNMSYNRTEVGKQYEVYIKALNILDLGEHDSYDFKNRTVLNYYDLLKRNNYDSDEVKLNEDYFRIQQIDSNSMKKLKKLGYDCVWGERKDIEWNPVDEIVVFLPTQIKSATKNNGNFQKNNPNMNETKSVYHGSPYYFNQFSSKKIGKGEQNQAYGWGLYFTSKKEIAVNYSNNLMKEYTKVSKKDINKLLKNKSDLIIDHLKWSQTLNDLQYGINRVIKKNEHIDDNTLTEIEEIQNFIDSRLKPTFVYSVDLHKGKETEQYDYMYWDGALTDTQKEKIRNYSIKVKETTVERYTQPDSTITVEYFYNFLSRHHFGSAKKTSLFLLKCGIDGIVYDSPENGKDIDDKNYVVFDENNITINKVQ